MGIVIAIHVQLSNVKDAVRWRSSVVCRLFQANDRSPDSMTL
jgi:hypothetical protein